MPRDLVLPLIKLPHAEGLDLPVYKTTGAAGFDLPAAVAANAPLMLAPMQRRLIPTGLCFALPKGYEMQIRPRSGLSFRHGITVLNAPGTIDSDYRGEVQVLLVNLGQENFTISRGMRIAQALIAPVLTAQFRLAAELDDTERGGSGFGSTGKY
ncbi:dUTP diphosphatase [Candidatus Tokpelaia sp.]|uniref:dUTP diphosphatase n=1 Tax=Candidatus Tokpelaia sp. TaxID=2233777 RepID=UPI00123B34A3|nr:dUTP diphosphatase [Candidatus Tokpelaia sp.]KAA6405690.1 dUTP diphosphatase [Candidatus Tokpelaia sp.]